MTEGANPGSDEAVEQGCTCPVIDNRHGAGAQVVDGVVLYWYAADCPVHRAQVERIVEEASE